MATQILEIEAESLEQARHLLKTQIPEGFFLSSEQIITDGKPRSAKGTADTAKEAFEKAQSEVPSLGSTILTKNEITQPEEKSIIIEAFDEQTALSSALEQAKTQLGNGELVKKSIALVAAGSKGVFGIGKKPNKYQVMILQQAIVEIVYKTKARIIFGLLDAKTFQEQVEKLPQLKTKLSELEIERDRLKKKLYVVVDTVYPEDKSNSWDQESDMYQGPPPEYIYEIDDQVEAQIDAIEELIEAARKELDNVEMLLQFQSLSSV